MSGLLVDLCGIDGSGKSTVAARLRDLLAERGHDAVVLRPLAGDGEFVGAVRTVMRELGGTGWSEGGREVDFLAAYFGYALAAAVERDVRPRLASGQTVICDRYLSSHLANQTAFGNDLAPFTSLLAWMPEPDAGFWIDVEVPVALERLAARGKRGVGDNEPFLTRARAAFADFAAERGYPRLDGAAPVEALAERVAAAVDGLRVA